MGQQGSCTLGSSTPFPEAGRRDLETFRQLLTNASAAHRRALDAHKDFLEECGSLQDSLSSLEACVLQNLEMPGASSGHSSGTLAVDSHLNRLRTAAETPGTRVTDLPQGASLEANAPPTPGPTSEGAPRGAAVRWAENVEYPELDDSSASQDDVESSVNVSVQPPCCKGRPQPPALLTNSSASWGSLASGDVTIWPEWSDESFASPSRSRRMDRRHTATPSAGMVGLESITSSRSPHMSRSRSTDELNGCCCQKMVLLPTSVKRTAWDMMSILVLAYDCIVIPLSVFNVGSSRGFLYIETAFMVFWTLDIVMSFLSGYYTLGGVEIRLSKIARRYIRSNFIFDLSLVLVDLLLTLAKLLEGDAVRLFRMGKFFRFAKIFRLLRLLRLLKLPESIRQVTDAMQSKTFATFVGIAQVVCLIGVVNHFIACLWYLLSWNAEAEWGMPAWTTDRGMEDRSDAYLYFSALHWSITQFTPASMEVQPKNVPERIFAIVVVFTALMAFSSFVSGITTAMTSLREHNRYKHNQLDKLRRYIVGKRISLDLSNRISAFTNVHKFMAKKKVIQSDIHVFSVLPTSLKYELCWEAHSQFISAHHFFFQVGEYEWDALIDICVKVVGEALYDPARDVFIPGQDAPDMLFLLDGIVEYSRGGQGLEESPEKFQRCGVQNPVFCELALWIRFAHSGKLTSHTTSEFLVLPSSSFRNCITNYFELNIACREYVRELVRVLGADSEPSGWDVLHKFDELQGIAQRAFDGAFMDPDYVDHVKRADFARVSQKCRKKRDMPSTNSKRSSFSSIFSGA